MSAQYELFHKPIETRFADWRHTPPGGEVTNKFIRLAIGLKRRGFKHHSSKAIVERLRWHYAMKHGPKNSSAFKINNNWTSMLARFAEERAPELEGFFRKRGLGTPTKKKRAVVVLDIQEKKA